MVAAQAQKHLHKGPQKKLLHLQSETSPKYQRGFGENSGRVWAPRMQHIQIGFYGDETEEKRVSRGKWALASAEEGEVAFPAAHLAAHVGHYVVEVPSGQVGAQAAAAAAQALQTVLLSCWHNKTRQMIQFSLSF